MESHQPIAAIKPEDLSIGPANQASWADLKAVFGQRDSGRCNCQRFKTRGWFWEQTADGQRRASLRDQANCDDPGHLLRRPQGLPQARDHLRPRRRRR